MLRNKKGQAQLWEIVLLMAVFLGVFVWMDFKKQTESNQFKDQSKQANLVDHCTGLINIGCGSKEASNAKSNTTPTVEHKPILDTPIIVEPVEPTFSLSRTLGVPQQQLNNIGHLSGLERFGLDIAIIFVVVVLGGLLDALGGFAFLFCRRYVMPSLIALGVSTITYTFYPVWYAWLAGLAVTPMMGTLCLGYGNFGTGNFSRAMWLFVQAVVAGIFLLAISVFFHAHLLAWWLFIWYAVSTGVWGGLYKNWQQFKGDWITGGWLCSLVLYVYLTLQFGW